MVGRHWGLFLCVEPIGDGLPAAHLASAKLVSRRRSALGSRDLLPCRGFRRRQGGCRVHEVSVVGAVPPPPVRRHCEAVDDNADTVSTSQCTACKLA